MVHLRVVHPWRPPAVLPCQLSNSCRGRQVRSALLAWYDTHHRVLPWRRNARSRRSPPAPGEPQPAPADLPAGVFAYWVWVCEARPAATAAEASADALRCFLCSICPHVIGAPGKVHGWLLWAVHALCCALRP